MKLTEGRVKALQPGDHRTRDYFDDEVRGFHVRVSRHTYLEEKRQALGALARMVQRVLACEEATVAPLHEARGG